MNVVAGIRKTQPGRTELHDEFSIRPRWWSRN